MTLSAQQIQTSYKQALAHQTAGQAEQALALYSSLLDSNPNLVEVHYQVASIFKNAFQYDKALRHIAHATNLRPNEKALWALYGDILYALNNADSTKAALALLKKSKLPLGDQKAITKHIQGPRPLKEPSLNGVKPKQMADLAGLLSKGQFKTVVDQATALLKSHPNTAALHSIQGAALSHLGQTTAAETSFARALAVAPNYLDGLCNFGQFLIDQSRHNDALSQFQRARALAPNDPRVLIGLGTAHFGLGQLDAAKPLFERAARKKTTEAQAQFFLGNIAATQSDHAQAITHFKRALAKNPKSSESHLSLGIAQAQLGELPAAAKSYAAALRHNPRSYKTLYRRGLLAQTSGDFDAANADFQACLDINPDFGPAYVAFVKAQKLHSDDPLIAKMDALFQNESNPLSERAALGFALSKVMEDTKQYDRVFAYLNPANSLTRQEHPYDIQERHTEIALLQSRFQNFDLSAFDGKGYQDFAPIFVTGMPRSGTTLVEQIIASHSRVTGGGEIGRARNLALEFTGDAQGRMQNPMDMPNADWSQLGQDIKAAYREIMPNSDIITDKGIPTYTAMGLIKAALPKARFIVVRRDPRDNLLSIYKNQFVDGTHRYAYDLSDLGAYYKTFVNMIDFWRDRTPDAFYEIQYEDLIADAEPQARALIDACGLEWEDACMNFHQNKREVKTLSVYQVRQPIYASSVKAWQRYETELQPLFEALK